MAQYENQVKQVKLEMENDFNNKLGEMRSKHDLEKSRLKMM